MNPLAAGRFRPASPCGRPVSWAATGRWGGVSRVPFDSLNLSPAVGDDQAMVQINQQQVTELIGATELQALDAKHGAKVAVASRGGIANECDGVVTTTPGLALLVLAADCVPIVLADPAHGVIAVAHCGWRGLTAGIVHATVTVMREQGAVNIQAITGPAICARCYPVQIDCIDQLRDALPQSHFADVAVSTDDQWRVDVRAGVHLQLADLDVTFSSIQRCTYEDPSLFSYRRDGRTGRHGMIVVQ